MSAYLIAIVDVKDMDRYQEYMKASPGPVAAHGGRFIARGGEKATLEGPEETRRVVLLEFSSMEKIKEFYNSAEYQKAKKLREGAAQATFIAVDGVK
jgi:uncharacterized protein (DUF1330 family)